MAITASPPPGVCAIALITIAVVLLQPLVLAHKLNCGGSCKTVNDCAGQLVCVSGRCNDEPDGATQICSGGIGGDGSSGGSCRANDGNSASCCESNSCHKTVCSPAISRKTPAILTVNDFSKGGDGGGPSECDGKYHANSKKVVALSTGWYNGGSRCGKKIRIYGNGRSTTATVVDECDSQHGCDKEHGGQPPCANNIVDGSSAVWKALGVSSNDDRFGFMHVTWHDS